VADRDVVIQVEEGKNLTLTGSVGLRLERGAQGDQTGDQAQPPDAGGGGAVTGGGAQIHERISIAAAHRNLFGTGRYLGIELVGGREEKEAFLTYREPFISRWDVPLQFQIFQSDDSTREGTTIRQRGLSIEASKVARQRTRWSLRYEYKISECIEGNLCDELDETADPVESLDPVLRDIQIASITPTFFWDTRDDIIDPHRGFFTSASVEYAFPVFSAKANFLKEYVQGAWYLPVTRTTVFALSGRAGLIQNYGRTDEGDVLPVPLSERFTAGGKTRIAPSHSTASAICASILTSRKTACRPSRSSTRTFQRFVGPVLPLGGNALLLVNAEYRFPLLGAVGGAVFADIGNVFAKTIQFDQLRYGAGIGIRYLSPVGPLRIDVARPFRRYQTYEKDSFQYFISIGYAF
jgi:translocation and assembly module TamA